MEITYASHHRWRKNLQHDGAEGFGKNATAKIKSTLNKIDPAVIEYKIAPLDEEFVEWFTPIYEDRINEKDNPKIFAIKDLLDNTERQYYYLKLLENNTPLGATTFRFDETNKVCVIAYRIYENRWKNSKLQAQPSLFTEYLLCEHALKKDMRELSHGMDRNPYGLNSSIGLAAFKLSVGCKPRKSGEYEVKSINTDEIKTDAFILEYPGKETEEIKKAYLVTTPENEHKWSQVTKYPHLLEVDVVYRFNT